jgi:four helix bundle protein
MFNFEKLDVWHKAIALADRVYELTGNFPADERFGLTNQMRRAAVSVSSNIAEGASRSSKTDYARFLEVAAGSLFEVVSQATLARRREYLTGEHHAEIYLAAEELSRMLSGLRASILGYLREDEIFPPLNSQLSTLNLPPTLNSQPA